MLVLSIANHHIKQNHRYFEYIDCIEYRLDLMKNFKFEHPPKPFIFTLRHQSHGGDFQGSIDTLCQTLLDYCQYLPDFVDLDVRLPATIFAKIRKEYPQIKIIASYHQFYADIEKLKTYLNDNIDCDVLKMAMVCDNAIDVLHLFKLKAKKPLALIPMGEKASFGRVLGKVIGNVFDYAAVNREQATAQGQLCLDELIDIYHYHDLNQATKIYALLANPVDKSVGHVFHNQAFQKRRQNAVYVKIQQDKERLNELLQLMLNFPFYGLSLSMPLKQSVKQEQIINTLVRVNNVWRTFNTDGQAVINLLELKSGMRVLILGNGGAAKGIAQACIQLGIQVSFLARQGGDYQFEDDIPLFDVIINTLPQHAFIERPFFISKLDTLTKHAQKRLDVIYHEITAFQYSCIKQQLPFISGHNMFEAQAELQQDLWKSI